MYSKGPDSDNQPDPDSPESAVSQNSQNSVSPLVVVVVVVVVVVFIVVVVVVVVVDMVGSEHLAFSSSGTTFFFFPFPSLIQVVATSRSIPTTGSATSACFTSSSVQT